MIRAGMSKACLSPSTLKLFFCKQSTNFKGNSSISRLPYQMKASFPGTSFICYQSGAQMAFYVCPSASGWGRGGKLRLNWLPLGIKAETKILCFVQLGVGVTDVTPGLLWSIRNLTSRRRIAGSNEQTVCIGNLLAQMIISQCRRLSA